MLTNCETLSLREGMEIAYFFIVGGRLHIAGYTFLGQHSHSP